MMGAILPFMTRMMVTGVYDVTNTGFESTSVITNTTPIRPFRGAGRPEATAALERAVDLFATEIGMDPAEVRRRNLLGDDVFPYTTPGGALYDIGAYGTALETLLEAAGYDGLRAEQARRREAGDGRQLGIGLAVYVEITGAGGGGEFGNDRPRWPTAPSRSAPAPPPSARATTPRGPCSPRTAWACPLDAVRVIHGDTDEMATSSVTGGSRSVQIAGSSIVSAAEHLIDLARRACGRAAGGGTRGRGPRHRQRPVPRGRRPRRRRRLGRGGRRRRRAAGRQLRLRRRGRHLPVRRPPGGRRGRHRDRGPSSSPAWWPSTTPGR